MKHPITRILSSLLLVTLLALAGGCATEKSQAALLAKAKISQAQAQQIALTKAPGGTVKSGELEEEKGKLIWSFDIATPDSKDLTEVAVDAISGEVIAVEKETPAQEQKEKKAKAK